MSTERRYPPMGGLGPIPGSAIRDYARTEGYDPSRLLTVMRAVDEAYLEDLMEDVRDTTD